MKQINKRVRCYSMGTFLSMAMLASAVAAADPVPDPRPPYLAALPVQARFLMMGEAKKKQGGKTDIVYIKEFDMNKVGDTKHGVITYSSGTTSSSWIYQGNFVSVTGNPPSLFMIPAHDELGGDEFPFGRDDFAGLGWVDHSHYRGVSQLDGEPCYVFDSASTGNVLWVSVARHYPLLLERDDVIYHFRYLDPPASLALPADIAQAWKENERLAGKLISRGKHPE